MLYMSLMYMYMHVQCIPCDIYAGMMERCAESNGMHVNGMNENLHVH